MAKTNTTVSRRAFNQDTCRAERPARKGPVFITDRGRPSYVLLTVEEYRRLAGVSFGSQTLTDVLAMSVAEKIELGVVH